MAKTWESAGSTDFVITTVNVPDRLDVQEVRAREDEDDERTGRFRIDWYGIRIWFVRILIFGLIAAAGWFAWESAQPMREELSAARIAERLSVATGQPVKVGHTEFLFTPTPRFVVSDIQVGKVIGLESVSLHFNWEDALRALRGGGWIWGEASVAPLALDGRQGEFLMRSLRNLGVALPRSISTLRFESVEFAGVRELPGQFEGVVRRQAEGEFGAATLTSADGNTKLNVTPAAGATSDTVGFQLDAVNWRATAGPKVPWGEAHISGHVRDGLIEIPEFLLLGYFGAVKGSVYAASDVEWVITGTAVGSNLDIESMLRQVGALGAADEAAGRRPVPMEGTASVELTLMGRGPTLSDAIDATVAAGALKVRWATVHGINLGYAATRPGSQSGGGGITRFTELTGWIVGSAKGTTIHDIRARAGALATRGDVAIAPDGRLSGALRVDLGGTRIQAPLNLRVHGKLLTPEFGR